MTYNTKSPITQVVKLLARSYAVTHNVTVEEHPGYHLLGNLVVFFSEMLSKQSKLVYKYHRTNSNPGQNPSTDVAIVLKCLSGGAGVMRSALG